MNNLVIKVWDGDCPVCRTMKKTEDEAHEKLGTIFMSMDLEFAALHPDLYKYISDNVADNNGDVELPIYLFMEDNNNGNIIGHHTGMGTARQISPLKVTL